MVIRIEVRRSGVAFMLRRASLGSCSDSLFRHCSFDFFFAMPAGVMGWAVRVGYVSCFVVSIHPYLIFHVGRSFARFISGGGC